MKKYAYFKRLSKFETELNNVAKRSNNLYDIYTGSFFTKDLDTENGNPENREWYEVVHVDFEEKSIYVLPVNEYGNKYTITQMRKILTEKELKNVDSFGFSRKFSAHFYNEWLLVDTVECYDDKGKVGREVDASTSFYFLEYDENGEVMPSDQWFIENPLKEFDPEFDDTYQNRTKTYPARLLKGKELKRAGTFKDRKLFEEGLKEERLALEKKVDKYKEVRMHSPYSGFTSDFFEACKDIENLSDIDSKYFYEEFKTITNPLNKEVNYGTRIRDFKKWCVEKKLNWKAVKKAITDYMDDFRRAYNAS